MPQGDKDKFKMMKFLPQGDKDKNDEISGQKWP